MTLSPSTPLTQENAALLKAGDWIDHPEWGLAQYQPVSDDDNSLTGPWTYIGPDLGDGWIGWGGGENPVPGQVVDVRYSDHEVLSGRAGGFKWRHRSELGWSNIIAFRPALAKPAEGELARQIDVLRRAAAVPIPDDDSDLTAEKARRGAQSWRNIAANVVAAYDATPTPPSVDWERVGPKLVEALVNIKAGGSWQGDAAADALAAAQPEGK